MGKDIDLAASDDNQKNDWAILDAGALGREVDSLWGLSQEVSSEVNGGWSKVYRGALRLFGKEPGDNNRLYTLLTAMRERAGGIHLKLNQLEQVYKERSGKTQAFFDRLEQKQETSIGLLQRLDESMKETTITLESKSKELEKMDEWQDGYHRTKGAALMSLVDQNVLTSYTDGIQTNVRVRNHLTQKTTVDLLSTNKVHSILNVFKDRFEDVINYFESTVGVRMYEIQAGKVSAEAIGVINDFGKEVDNLYKQSRQWLKQLRFIESGNLRAIGLTGHSGQSSGVSLDTSVVRYLSKGKG